MPQNRPHMIQTCRVQLRIAADQFGDLVAMEAYRRSLLQQASGDDLSA